MKSLTRAELNRLLDVAKGVSTRDFLSPAGFLTVVTTETPGTRQSGKLTILSFYGTYSCLFS
jgi:hypothetical protein